jgi:hypothetical protein
MTDLIEPDEHPHWCDLTRCTVKPEAVNPEGEGDHRSAPVRIDRAVAGTPAFELSWWLPGYEPIEATPLVALATIGEGADREGPEQTFELFPEQLWSLGRAVIEFAVRTDVMSGRYDVGLPQLDGMQAFARAAAANH